DFKKFKNVKKYIAEIYGRIKPEGFSEYEAWFLVTNYGKQTETILENYARLDDKDKSVRMAKAELQFGIDYEMVQNPMDFFIRRTGRLYFDIDGMRHLIEPILEEFQRIFKVDEDQILVWREVLQNELEEHSNFTLQRV
ncbi:MAG: glycerol-3-phosphate dehydrogenase, partial [Flavobacteriales bacterium]